MCFKKEKELGLLGPDPVDIRDYELATIQPEMVSLPSSYCFMDKMLSIQRQFWGTCTSHAVDGIKEFQEGVKLSQRFIYYNTKKISGLWNIQGDYTRNTMKAVVKYGAPPEDVFPDSKDGSWENYISKEPPLSAYEKAEPYKGKTYFVVGKTLEEFQQAIYQNKCPIGLGMGWWQSYYGIKSDGKLPLLTGKRYGGHAISCVGWEGNKLWFRNSHGANWGNQGYFYIPFNEFDKHEIWDARVLLDLQELEGWVASKYLTLEDFIVGNKAFPYVRLNIREEPNGKRITTLDKGQKLIIVGEKQKVGSYEWIKVKTI